MKIITKKVQSPTTDEAIKYLEAEYPLGVELTYVDYRDCYEDMEQLQRVLKDEIEDINDWEADAQYESIREIKKQYSESEDGEAFEISDEVEEAMSDWLFEHDTSDPIQQLLKNTGSKLMYIETEDYSEESGDTKQNKQIVKKYGKTEADKKDIQYVLDNQFYGAPVSFYFYADVLDVFNAIHKSESKYIQVSGAYFSTIDRVQGSNWLGDKAIFTLTVPREDFIKNFYLDGAKGTGYGWGEIAGQSGYDEAGVCATDTRKRGSVLIKSETSEAQAREARLQANWDKTKKCTRGDMNWKRHTGEKEYRNDYPCGNTCEDCGTFWID